MQSSEIAGICNTQVKTNIKIKHLFYDSRKVQENGLFFAIKGHKTDGNRFVPHLLEEFNQICIVSENNYKDDRCIKVKDVRQCMGKIASAFYEHPSKKLKVIGITGTNGKTTTTYLLKSILENESEIIGTTGYTLKGKTITLPNTTPESVDLQKILKSMVEIGAKYCFMEVSAHAISLKRTSGTTFAVKAFTNISQDHLDYYGTIEQYAAAKLSFFTPEDKKVINIDDQYGKRLIDKEALTYGFSKETDIYPKEYSFDMEGIKAKLHSPVGELSIESNLIGKHNLYNIMCATAVAIILDCDKKKIEKGISLCRHVPGRLEFFKKNNRYAVVDYAHTDDAMANILKSLNEVRTGRLIVVFGAGGDRDKGKRPKMGKVATHMADIVIVTSDNPRSEEPQAIINDILAGIDSMDGVYIEPDRKKAIIKALDMAKPNDVVAILGKGHEDYQIIKGKKIHFDDREVVREHWQL